MKRFFIPVAFCIACAACAPNSSDEMGNPVIDNIMARRSVRHYTDTPVEREKLQQLVECGINAPNAMNKQAWELRVVTDDNYFNELTAVMKDAMPFLAKDDDPKFRNAFRNATAAIFIACPDDESGMSLINVGLLGENICLAAQSLGLGTCVMGGPAMVMNIAPDAKPYLDSLCFSEGYKLRLVIGVGYPDEQPDAKPRDLSKVRFMD